MLCVLIRIASSRYILNQQLWDFSKGVKNEFETAVVNEPSVFEPLKFCCICKICAFYTSGKDGLEIMT